jgi:hypothetical protein
VAFERQGRIVLDLAATKDTMGLVAFWEFCGQTALDLLQ